MSDREHLRASAGKAGRPRTYTAHARNNIRAAADFTAWLARHGRSLQQCRQADVDDWCCPALKTTTKAAFTMPMW